MQDTLVFSCQYLNDKHVFFIRSVVITYLHELHVHANCTLTNVVCCILRTPFHQVYALKYHKEYDMWSFTLVESSGKLSERIHYVDVYVINCKTIYPFTIDTTNLYVLPCTWCELYWW